MRKNKVLVSVMVVSLVTAITAGTINAQIVTGYETFKQAVRSGLMLRNATVEIKVASSLRGKELQGETTVLKADLDNKMMQSTQIYTNTDGTTSSYENFTTSNMNINSYPGENGEMQYSVNEYEMDSSQFDNIFQVPNKAVDIAEIATDAFVGSCKEYLIKETNDDVTTIKGDYDKTQIPQIGNAIASLAVSQTHADLKRWDKYEPDGESFESAIYENGYNNGYISNVTIDSTVDENEVFETLNISGRVMLQSPTGKEEPIDLSIKIKIYDKGSTVVTLPNIKKDEANVVWNEYTPGVDYYEQNKDVIEKYQGMTDPLNQSLYNSELTPEKKAQIMEAIEAFNKVMGSDEVSDKASDENSTENTKKGSSGKEEDEGKEAADTSKDENSQTTKASDDIPDKSTDSIEDSTSSTAGNQM